MTRRCYTNKVASGLDVIFEYARANELNRASLALDWLASGHVSERAVLDSLDAALDWISYKRCQAENRQVRRSK